MKLDRIFALIWRDYKTFLRSRWRWLEFFYFPITSIIIWGLFALWTKELASQAGTIALIINVFWSYAYIVQSTINLSMNEDAWSGTGAQILITGITKFEFFFARIIFASIISFTNLLFMLWIIQSFFLNLLPILLPIFLLTILTALISITLALFIAGLIFMLGIDYSWLAWSALQFFILFSFPLSPIEILPSSIQLFARIMPFTAIFQSVRNLLLGFNWANYLLEITLVSCSYLFVGIVVLNFGFETARKNGKLAKMF